MARREGNSLGLVDESAFERWYGADRRHAEAYDRIAALWQIAGQVAPKEPRHRFTTVRPSFSVPQPLAAAASLLIFVAIGASTILTMREDPTLSPPVVLATAIGEIRPYALPDGSHVVLDTRSKARIAYSGSLRRIALLAGRARFIVRREARPFAVDAAGRHLIATDTIFDVSVIGPEPEVRLLAGSLEVRRSGWTTGMTVARLRTGDEVVLAGGREPVRRRIGGDGIAWPKHMLEFDATPLAEAVMLVNRYSHVPIRIAEPALDMTTISGAYRTGDTVGFARSVAVALGIHDRRLPDGSILLAKGRAI